MTKQEENEAISIWAGVECRCEDAPTNLMVCPIHGAYSYPPDYDRDEVAVSLLPILVEQGFIPRLEWIQSGKWLFDTNFKLPQSPFGIEPTIAAAIKKSILTLIEKENTQ